MHLFFSNKQNCFLVIIRWVLFGGLAFAPLTTMAQLMEVEAVATTRCHFIDTVQGFSGYGKKTEWKSYAKSDVRNRATELGASHVVWAQFNATGAFNGTVVAKLYDCSS
ncbi:MAG: hypothetical protein NTV00_12395 [Methylococcales bacterium]|nr:hypothetical protein [Methylococcales bacterium]